MQIRHLFASASAHKEIAGAFSVSLRNPAGDLFVYSNQRNTHTEGWHVFSKGHFLKLVERLEVINAGPLTGVTMTGATAYFHYQTGISVGIKPLANLSGLTISANRPCQISLSLDIRTLGSYPTFGREYTTIPDSEGLLVHYQEISDDPVYLHIRSRAKPQLISEWQEVSYSEQLPLHTYALAKYQSIAIAIGYGETAEKARIVSLAASRQRPTPLLPGGDHGHETLITQVTTARLCCERSLRSLNTSKGTWSGLPDKPFIEIIPELIAALGRSRDVQQGVLANYLRHNQSLSPEVLPWFCLLARQYTAPDFPKPLAAQIQLTFEETLRQSSLGTVLKKGMSLPQLEVVAGYSLLTEILGQLTSSPLYAREQAALQGVARRQNLDGNVALAYLLQPTLLSQPLWQDRFNSLRDLTPLTAIALNRIDPKKYVKAITSVLEDSTNKILWEGWLGHASEGNLQQSAAAAGLYMFLVKELDGYSSGGYGNGQVAEAASSFWEETAEDSRESFWV